MSRSYKILTLGHSPDPDDVALTYPILSGIISESSVRFQEVCLDIELLNRLVLLERLDISAVSVPAFLEVSHRYYLIRYGASIGYRYGPKLILRKRGNSKITVAVPGLHTTARVLTELFLKRSSYSNYVIVEIPHDKITYLLKLGVIDCGTVIHEEQLLVEEFRNIGFEVQDLGEWWYSETKLPLPLGLNVVNREVGLDLAQKISELYLRSIEYSLKNIDKIINIAVKYSRVDNIGLIKRFIQMYVRPNPISQDEIKAITTLYELASSEKIVHYSTEPEIIPV